MYCLSLNRTDPITTQKRDYFASEGNNNNIYKAMKHKCKTLITHIYTNSVIIRAKICYFDFKKLCFLIIIHLLIINSLFISSLISFTNSINPKYKTKK